jgi:pilus assembly protein CpaB
MPAKTILTLLFLTSLGVAVFICLQALPVRVNANTAAPREDILVATAMLPAGTLLRAKDVGWHPMTGPVEPGQILRPVGGVNYANGEFDQQARDEVYGAALRAEIQAGEPIRRSKIVKPGDRDFLQVVLSPGVRAIVIPVTTGGVSTGLLYPGDRVDVILTQSFKNDPPLTHRSVSETVVESLRVLAVDAADLKPTGASNGFGRTVTLEVTPEQAEKINVAAELGKLSLTLRGAAATSASVSANTTGIRATWAGDVSPALGDAMPPHKMITPERPSVEVIHGTKSVSVKVQ